MIASALVVLAALAQPLPGDTVVDVRRGDVLRLQNLEGRVLVGTWDRDEVGVDAEGGNVGFRLVRQGDAVQLSPRERKGRRRSRIYRVSVPPWIQLEVAGLSLDVAVRGVRAGVSVRTVDGNIDVRHVAGRVRVRSVEGEIRVEDVDGDVEASAADDEVVLDGVRGSARVENVDGDIRLWNVEADRVEATTVDGDVTFRGPLRAGGSYRLRTHDGEVTARVVGGVDARIVVSTHDGEFRSEFPVTLQRLDGGHEFRFTLGDGSAELALEAFDGDILLLRGGR